MNFTFKKLKINDVVLINSKKNTDKRGYFLENYNKINYFKNGIKINFIQDNISFSKKNVLRGLHFQKFPYAQAKLVSVIKGKIFDVAVDVRKKSPTYGKWVGEILSNENNKSLFIPEGFAHGFCVISEFALVSYKVNKKYSPKHESGIKWNDPILNISWPTEKPILSKKDNSLKSF